MIPADFRKQTVAHYVMYLHDFLLEESVAAIIPFVDKVLIARTTRPWFGTAADLGETEAALERLKDAYGERIAVFSREFPDEQSQRNFLLDFSRREGYSRAFIVDCDELFLPGAMPVICELLRSHAPKALMIPYLTFIRYANVCVSPPYETGLFYLDLKSDAGFIWARRPNTETLTMVCDRPLIAHFSYLRESDEDIIAKIRSFMHAGDTDWDLWFDKYYRNFDIRMRDFHPTNPSAWRELIPFDVNALPPGLTEKLRKTGKLYDFAEPFPAPSPPQEMHDRAVQLLEDGKRQEAVAEFHHLLDLYPAFTPARGDLALLFYEGGEMARARAELETCRRMTPWNTTILTNLAGLYCQLGEISGAISCYREIVTRRPGDAQAAANLSYLNNLAGTQELKRQATG